MADKAQATETKDSDEGTPAPAVTPPVPRRPSGHRGADVRDTVAEMAARAQEISMEAGSKVAAAMKDVINAAAGVTGFAIESARDLVQYMIRRGQMTQEEGDKLMREAEEANNRRPGGPLPLPFRPARRPRPRARPGPQHQHRSRLPRLRRRRRRPRRRGPTPHVPNRHGPKRHGQSRSGPLLPRRAPQRRRRKAARLRGPRNRRRQKRPQNRLSKLRQSQWRRRPSSAQPPRPLRRRANPVARRLRRRSANPVFLAQRVTQLPCHWRVVSNHSRKD